MSKASLHLLPGGLPATGLWSGKAIGLGEPC
jgi:hypothetical protein